MVAWVRSTEAPVHDASEFVFPRSPTFPGVYRRSRGSIEEENIHPHSVSIRVLNVLYCERVKGDGQMSRLSVTSGEELPASGRRSGTISPDRNGGGCSRGSICQATSINQWFVDAELTRYLSDDSELCRSYKKVMSVVHCKGTGRVADMSFVPSTHEKEKKIVREEAGGTPY